MAQKGNKIEWTREQEVWLLAHYLEFTLDDLGRRFGCSGVTIGNKLRSLGVNPSPLHKCPNRKVWTEYELNYLMEHYPTESAVDIGDHLGISSQMVRTKAIKMGIKKSPDYDTRQFMHRYVKNYKNNVVNYKAAV